LEFVPPFRSGYCIADQKCSSPTGREGRFILIPAFRVSTTAREFGVDKKARTFSPGSHGVALRFAQFTHALSRNDVCDALKNHAAKLLRIRRAVAPSKNAFSHANRQRDGEMAQALFWRILGHLYSLSPGFGGRRFQGMPRRFKRAVYAVDSMTIHWVANGIDWARHRRCDFLGDNKNAVLGQVGTALILYVLVRFLAYCNRGRPGFKRFFCLSARERLGRRAGGSFVHLVWDSWRCSRDARGTRAAVFARLGATPGARMSRPHLRLWDSKWPF
jgi:hypothetical protein